MPKKISLKKSGQTHQPPTPTRKKKSTLPIDLSQINFTQLLRDPIAYADNLSVKELELLLLIFKDYYYNTDTPLVPDLVYDEMEDVLRERAPESQVLTAVGSAPLPSERKTDLPYPMPSQNKAKSGSGDLEKWLKKYPGPYVVSHKLDGISLMFYRSDGRTRLFTRGTTHEGQDVSHLLPMLDLGRPRPKVPANLKEVAIRGELIMPKEVWDKHYADKYPNVRNWIAGQVAHKTSQPVNVGRIQLVTYEVIWPRMKPSEQFETLEEWDFHVSPYWLEGHLNEDKLLGRLKESVDQGPYQIDGLIVSQDELVTKISDSNPKASLAFKSQMGEGAKTVVKEVIWQVSKDGLLKPVVLIEPVFLSGATISKASGINAKYIVENRIGRGAEITIIRSGEVIPFITQVNVPADKPDLPESYQYEWTNSGVDLVLSDDQEDNGAAYREMALRRLVHMVKHLKIDHLGPGSLKKLVALGYLEPNEILNISYEELYEGANLGANAIKMYNSLQHVLMTKGVRLAQLMDASGTFAGGIGTRKMQLVLDHIPDLLERWEKESDRKGGLKTLEQDLLAIKGMGSETVPLILEGLPKFLDFMKGLPEGTRILDLERKKRVSSELGGELGGELGESELARPQLADWRFVFTGLRPSADLEEVIRVSGGTVANSVATKLKEGESQLVIAKDPDSGSNKLKKAREMGVEVLSLDEFLEQFDLEDLG